QHLVPVGQFEVGDPGRLIGGESGVVDEHVDLAGPVQDGRDRPADPVLVADVAGQCGGLAAVGADLGDCGVQAGRGPAQCGDLGALGRKPAGNSQPDAGAG